MQSARNDFQFAEAIPMSIAKEPTFKQIMAFRIRFRRVLLTLSQTFSRRHRGPFRRVSLFTYRSALLYTRSFQLFSRQHALSVLLGGSPLQETGSQLPQIGHAFSLRCTSLQSHYYCYVGHTLRLPRAHMWTRSERLYITNSVSAGHSLDTPDMSSNLP
jgi:hypothetical protein